MALHIGEEAPNFTADTTEGTINLHEWIGDGWAILFSHPKDFTPVCTTELGYMAGLKSEFEKRNCKVIFLTGLIIVHPGMEPGRVENGPPFLFLPGLFLQIDNFDTHNDPPRLSFF